MGGVVVPYAAVMRDDPQIDDRDRDSGCGQDDYQRQRMEIRRSCERDAKGYVTNARRTNETRTAVAFHRDAVVTRQRMRRQQRIQPDSREHNRNGPSEVKDSAQRVSCRTRRELIL